MSDIDSDPEFTAYLDNLEASRTENDDKYSDISVSSVHTSDLTYFDEDSLDSDSDKDPGVPVRNILESWRFVIAAAWGLCSV